MIHPDINSYQHTLTAHTFFTYPATKTSNTHENMTTPTSPRYTHVYKHHPISRLGTGYRPQRPAESDWLKTIPRASWWLNFGPETPWRGFQKGCWKRNSGLEGAASIFRTHAPLNVSNARGERVHPCALPIHPVTCWGWSLLCDRFRNEFCGVNVMIRIIRKKNSRENCWNFQKMREGK